MHSHSLNLYPIKNEEVEEENTAAAAGISEAEPSNPFDMAALVEAWEINSDSHILRSVLEGGSAPVDVAAAAQTKVAEVSLPTEKMLAGVSSTELPPFWLDWGLVE